MTDYIINERGEEVISERHQKDYKSDHEGENVSTATKSFSDLNFEDI
jgi:hypothetical protein